MPIKPISPKKAKTSFAVSDYFATLVATIKNHYYINIAFSIDKKELLKNVPTNGIEKVNIKVYKKTYQNQSNSNDSVNSPGISNNFLTKGLNSFLAAATIANTKILEETVFLTNYDVPSAEKRKILYPGISPFTSKVSSSQNLNIPSTAITSLFSLRNKNLSIIKNIKIDPAEAILLQEYKSNNDINSLVNHYLLNSTTSLAKDEVYYGSIESDSKKTKCYINYQIIIPEVYKLEQLEIIFELHTNSPSGISPFEKIKKTFNIKDLLSIKTATIKKPSISEIEIRKNVPGLQILRNDKFASGLTVEKKVINSNNQVSTYSTIFKKVGFEIGGGEKISQTNLLAAIQIYRCTAFDSDSSSIRSSAYKNIIFGTIPFIDPTIILIKDDQQEKAVEIAVQKPPPEASEFQIIKRRISNNGLGTLEEEQQVSAFISTQPIPTVVYDKMVISGEYYEYTVKYKLVDSTIKSSVSKIHKFVDSSVVKNIITTITDKQTSSTSDGLVVSFTISSIAALSDNDTIAQALDKISTINLYQTAFNKLKDKLEDIIFYKITRINLSISPGVAEEFKEMYANGAQFVDDLKNRQNSGVSELNPNHDYVYEVRAYYKNPINFLKDLVTTVPKQVNSKTGKTTKEYKYKPYKWLQQNALNYGTLSAENDVGEISQYSIIDAGDIGVVASAVIDRLETVLELKSAMAKRVDINSVYINWNINTIVNDYDHFVIVKESKGKRQILATSRSLHHVDVISEDAGTVIYYITPVYNDYTIGPTIRTNSIIVNPEEITYNMIGL